MEFKKYVIEDFIEDLSGDSSSPGGGSTAALVGALASSLNSMVYSFTVDKKSFETLDIETKAKMIDFQKDSRRFSQLSLDFMELDRKYFIALMDSFKLPKVNEEEKEIRINTIRANTIASMEVPLELAKEALEFYDNIEFAVAYGNKNLTSDAIVAAILLHSTIESAIVNVEINYNSLDVKENYKDIPKLCAEILMQSNEKKTKICNIFSFLNK